MWLVEDRTQIWRLKLVFWKVSWQGSRVSPLDHPRSITQTTKAQKVCHKKKDLSRAKNFVPRKKIHGQKVVTRISLIYNEVKKGDLMSTKKCCRVMSNWALDFPMFVLQI